MIKILRPDEVEPVRHNVGTHDQGQALANDLLQTSRKFSFILIYCDYFDIISSTLKKKNPYLDGEYKPNV